MNIIRSAFRARVALAAVLLCVVSATCLGARGKNKPADLGSLPPEFWTELGSLYLRWQVNDKADEAFAKAIELATDPAAKARIYQQLALAYMQAGNAKKAFAALDAAIELTPDEQAAREYRSQRAELHVALGDIRKGIEEYGALLALGGTPAELAAVRLPWLQLHEQAGTLKRVIADCTARLAKDAADAEALDTLSIVYAAVQPDTDKLAGVLEKLAAARPDDADCKRQLVNVYRELGRHDKAAALLEAIVETAPGPSRASYYTMIAEEYAAMGKPDAAAGWIEKLLAADAGSYLVRLQAAQLYGRIGKPDLALAQFTLAIAGAPTTREQQYVQFELAGFYVEQDRRDEARALLATLVEHAEDSALRAQAVRRLGELTGSVPLEEQDQP